METFGGQVTIFVIVLNVVRAETLTPPRLYLCFLLIEYIFRGPSAQFTAEIILRGGLRSSHPPPSPLPHPHLEVKTPALQVATQNRNTIQSMNYSRIISTTKCKHYIIDRY